jgi:hypothetical protein
MKSSYFVPLAAIAIAIGLGGTQAPIARPFDPQFLTGNVKLRLDKAVWKLWENKPVTQDLWLDLTCNQGQCESEVWGFAPSFNRDVDHSGQVLVKTQLDNGLWELKFNLQIQPHPDHKTLQSANYTVRLIPYQSHLLGSYQGQMNGRSRSGKVWGELAPPYPQPISAHHPLKPQEHPRLIFRAQQLPALQAKAKTPEGMAILAQLRKALAGPVYEKGLIPTASFHGAGYCFLSWIDTANPTDKPSADLPSAQRAWQLVNKAMTQPGARRLEQSAVVAGVALAYDLCYAQWDATQRQTTTRWLAHQSDRLLRGDRVKNGWNSYPGSNWNGRAKGAAGLAALAIWQEPQSNLSKEFDSYRAIRVAERNVIRYMTTALGDRGFGIEGDHYSTEPLILTIFPFIQAYRNVMGKDLLTGSPAQGLTSLYLMRMVPQNGQLAISPYGRHRSYVGAQLLTMALGILPPQDYPAVKNVFDRYVGLQGDRSFGIDSNFPQEAIYAMAGYKSNISAKNPVEILDRVQFDQQNGFYLFRNQWQGAGDFVASIYLKRKARGGWSFPEVGSWRLWGLGQEWAIAGKSDGKSLSENGVVLPQDQAWLMAEPIAFDSRPNGSGIISLQTLPIQAAGGQTLQAIRSFGVDYSGKSGAPGLFVLVDQFLGATSDPAFRDRQWILHTPANVTVQKQQFTIHSPKGATLQGTFITPEAVKIKVQKDGTDQIIQATGDGDFLVVMTVQNGLAPQVNRQGNGLESVVRVGKQAIYFNGQKIIFSEF